MTTLRIIWKGIALGLAIVFIMFLLGLGVRKLGGQTAPPAQEFETKQLTPDGWKKLHDIADRAKQLQKDLAQLQTDELKSAGVDGKDGWRLQWDFTAGSPVVGYLVRPKAAAPASH